ncbi:MAG: hypothetical protein JWM43_1545 [Acidobacteriaceae bacterium]|nr:hypothetical protein [Acidobacteriaceae bacterium]
MAASLARAHRTLARTLAAILCLPLLAHAQQPPQPADSPALQAAADKAISFVIQREALDPNALVPDTGKPLPPSGSWSAARQRPASCPQSTDICLRVVYRVPNTTVSCEWVVLFQPDSVHGTILEQNLDSVRYLLRTVPTTEVQSLILSRALPLAPRNASGTIELRVYVGASGNAINSFVTSGGPEGLRTVSLVAARQWLFKPLMAGNRAIPYQLSIKFNFSPSGRVTSEP